MLAHRLLLQHDEFCFACCVYGGNGGVPPADSALNRDSVEVTEANIRAGVDNGEIRRGLDARTEAVLILAAVRGAIAQWLIDPEMVDLAAARTVFITSLRQRLRR